MGKRSNAVRPRDLLAEILQAAERHGQAADPEHEIGDLQDALRIAWSVLTAAERDRVRAEYFRDHDSWVE